MTNVMKKITAGFGLLLASTMLVFASQPTTAWAAGADPEVFLNSTGSGIEVQVAGNASTGDVSTLALTLNLEPNETVPNAVTSSFEFSPFIMNNTTIHEFRVVEGGTIDRMQIYVAGGNNLLAGTLDLGKVTFKVDAADPGATLKVTLPADALRTVDSGYTEATRSVHTTTGSASVSFVDGNPQVTTTDLDGNDSTAKGGGNFLSAIGEKLSQTGDMQTMVVGGLVAVVAVALLIMGIALVLRKKKGATDSSES